MSSQDVTCTLQQEKCDSILYEWVFLPIQVVPQIKKRFVLCQSILTWDFFLYTRELLSKQ